MIFDSNKLKGIIKEKQLTQEEMAQKLNISKSTFNLKINGNAYFSQEEIFKISRILNIPDNLFKEYFFTLKV